MQFEINGESIFATTGGKDFDPTQPVLIFLHGAGFDHSVWNLQTRYFAHRGFSVLAVDFPGNGRSSGKTPSEIEHMADWVPKMMDGSGVKEATLIGHSMGSLVALECAVRHPQRVRSISLLGASEKMPVHPDLLEAAKRNDPLAYQLVCSWGLGRRGHMGGAPMPGMSLMGSGLSLMASVFNDALGAGLEACHQYASGEESAKKVQCSSIVIAGSQDKMTPSSKGLKLAESITNCKLVVLSECGHMMMLEDSKACLDALKKNI